MNGNFDPLSPMIGQADSFRQVMADISRLAPLAQPVLVIGERGTGKELVAARLHYLSPRWNQPFIKLNCAALSPSLLESELFGHEAGSFTGAQKRRLGRFERADRGTFFLDEIAAAPMPVQESLLRVVEYGSFERIGGNETVTTNVRLIAATNIDLPAAVAAGRFRADLLDRLAFDVVTLPPLRARAEDIEVLAQHMAVQMTKTLQRPSFPGFTAAALRALKAYSWPGNIRELKNVVERAVYRMSDPDQPIDRLIFDPFQSPWRPEQAATPLGFLEQVKALEIRLIREALATNSFSQKKTADALGLTYHQLRNYLRKYGIGQTDQEGLPGELSPGPQGWGE